MTGFVATAIVSRLYTRGLSSLNTTRAALTEIGYTSGSYQQHYAIPQLLVQSAFLKVLPNLYIILLYYRASYFFICPLLWST
jgi:hypothetical protein